MIYIFNYEMIYELLVINIFQKVRNVLKLIIIYYTIDVVAVAQWFLFRLLLE